MCKNRIYVDLVLKNLIVRCIYDFIIIGKMFVLQDYRSKSPNLERIELHACTMDTYRFRLEIWNGASMDNIVWEGSQYQSDPATPIKSLSDKIGDGLANKTK